LSDRSEIKVGWIDLQGGNGREREGKPVDVGMSWGLREEEWGLSLRRQVQLQTFAGLKFSFRLPQA
jgi:hypothetical protein